MFSSLFQQFDMLIKAETLVEHALKQLSNDHIDEDSFSSAICFFRMGRYNGISARHGRVERLQFAHLILG